MAVPQTVSPESAGQTSKQPQTAPKQAPKGKDKTENAELSKAIGKVHVLGNEVPCLTQYVLDLLCAAADLFACQHSADAQEAAIWPESYEERQSPYATFMRHGL